MPCKCRIFRRKWSRRPPFGRILGIVCILLAILLLLLCAPGWLIALIASGLLLLFGAWLLFGCPGGKPFER